MGFRSSRAPLSLQANRNVGAKDTPLWSAKQFPAWGIVRHPPGRRRQWDNIDNDGESSQAPARRPFAAETPTRGGRHGFL